MMLANTSVTLPSDTFLAVQLADPNSKFSKWPEDYGIEVQQERVFGVDLEDAGAYDEQDPAEREVQRIGILVKALPDLR